MGSRLVALVAIATVIAFLPGCAGFMSSCTPMGASTGTIVSDVTYPNYVGAAARYNLTTSDFTIIGPVSAEAKSTNILGMVAEGNNGYAKLFEAAQAAGGDDVISIKVDTQCKHYVFGVYSAATVKLTGFAIKYTKK